MIDVLRLLCAAVIGLFRSSTRREAEILVSVIRVFETASGADSERLWLVWLTTLRGMPLVLQAALSDSLTFDPFSLQQDCLAASEVDVGRG